MMNNKSNIAGIIAEFETPKQLLEAAKKVRDAGYRHYDCHSPFPIHGMDDAMGEKRSPVGWIVGVMGFIGGTGALTLEWWTSAVDYPFIISGKPYFSVPAFIPIMFELTILLAAFGAVFGMLHLNRLPMLNHPVFESERFEQVTDDKFFVSILAKDSQFDETKTAEFLESLGSDYVELLPWGDEENASEEEQVATS